MEYNFAKTGFRIEGGGIEFYCDADSFLDLGQDEEVFVAGSFNGWQMRADSAWRMERKISKSGVSFSLKKSLSQIAIPGNTGFPEFQFFAFSKNSFRPLTEKNIFSQATFERNKLIFQSKEEFDSIQKIVGRQGFRKSLSDFDLNCPACRADISNVRIVPGTKCLLRGYNPFKRSKNEFDTEDLRIELVQKAFKIFGVNCDITLNGDEGAVAELGEKMPAELEKIQNAGNRLCIDIDYNLVYYRPEADEFSAALKKIAEFILERAGPYYIHCRLGSDRTGVTCAVFAALCGASWNEIAADYERTSNMGAGEYRNQRLLQYSLQKMLGVNPAKSPDLAKAMRSYFEKNGILTAEQIRRLVERLCVPLKSDGEGYFDFFQKHICKIYKK